MNRWNSLFEQQFSEIIEEVYEQAKCEFAQTYVDIPPIPWIRMQVLFLFLHNSKVEPEKIKKYLVSTLLIQIGLDCHEEVSLLKQETERGIRTRQLSVLTGDYYSSKYYYLLSHMEDIELIRQLARSIYSINEEKIQLYVMKQQNPDQTLQARNRIDSALYVGFIPRFGNRSSEFDWERAMQQFILAERLLDELLSYRLGKVAKEILKQWGKASSLEIASQQLQDKLEYTLSHISGEIGKLQDPLIKSELHRMVNHLHRKAANEIQV